MKKETRMQSKGICDQCGQTFQYHLIHNGFNESAYAYCADCGMTVLLDTLYRDSLGIPRHRSITKEGEERLLPCDCGGTFRAGASPRCPHCRQPLSAKAARKWIEENAPGTAGGWQWQCDWIGLYAIVIEKNVVYNRLKQ